MSGSPVAPVSVTPISVAVAALRVQILGAAEAELLAMLDATQEVAAEPQPTQTASQPATPPNPVRQAVDGARTTAAGSQASLAPLFADLTQALATPRLPSEVKAAIAQVLAFQLPASGPIAAQDVQQAVARSGLFLEANLAAAPAAEPAPADLKTALLTLRQALPASPATDAPATSRQATPPAPNAAPPPQGPAPEEPVSQNPAPQPSATPAPSVSAGPVAPATPPGIAAPPVGLEPPAPQTAQTSPATPPTEPAPAPTASPQPGAIKAVADPVAAPQPPANGAATPGPVAPVAARPPIAQPAPLLEPVLASVLPEEAAPLDPKSALLTLQQAPPESPANAPAPAQRTPPPVRGAALSPQGPAPATLPPGAGLSSLVQHLRPQVEQALARLTLHQLASLPEGPSAAWMFELPLATPQGAAMAQFQIERDAPDTGAAEGAEAAPWRARFSIDIEPLGPVHVHVAMNGGKAAVSVWAERGDSLEWLRGQGAALASALPAEVVFRPGSPGGAAPARGHFLDQTS
jgi:hypothetical protein